MQINRFFSRVSILLFLVFVLGACSYNTLASAQLSTDDTHQKIDRLLSLMDQRLAVATLVARAKWNSGAAIDDPVREGQILDRLAASLKDVDASEKMFVRQFFQAQFDAGKIIQQHLHAQWRNNGQPAFANPPDLVRDIRPALDSLTPQLIEALLQVRPGEFVVSCVSQSV